MVHTKVLPRCQTFWEKFCCGLQSVVVYIRKERPLSKAPIHVAWPIAHLWTGNVLAVSCDRLSQWDVPALTTLITHKKTCVQLQKEEATEKWVSPRIPSRKMGRLNSYHETSRESQSNTITVSSILNTMILSRRPIYFSAELRVFLDAPTSDDVTSFSVWVSPICPHQIILAYCLWYCFEIWVSPKQPRENWVFVTLIFVAPHGLLFRLFDEQNMTMSYCIAKIVHYYVATTKFHVD